MPGRARGHAADNSRAPRLPAPNGARCRLGGHGWPQVPISCRRAARTCRSASVPPSHSGRVTVADSPGAPLPSWPGAAPARTTSGERDAAGGTSVPELGSLGHWARRAGPGTSLSGLAWACGALPGGPGTHTQSPAPGLEPSSPPQTLSPHLNPFLRFLAERKSWQVIQAEQTVQPEQRFLPHLPYFTESKISLV